MTDTTPHLIDLRAVSRRDATMDYDGSKTVDANAVNCGSLCRIADAQELASAYLRAALAVLVAVTVCGALFAGAVLWCLVGINDSLSHANRTESKP